ncbi:MAG: DUF6588 family protein [Bacteroidota bacterium]
MKQFYTLLILIVLASTSFAQLTDKLQIPQEDVEKYITPFATWTGTYFNSGGYYTASVAKTFGFKLSIIGMMIFIPEDQRTFNVNPYEGYSGDETSATVFGEKGAAVLGPENFIIYPPGFNVTSIPAGIPQVAFSFIGAEAMVRYFPKMNISDVDVSLLGWGLKYNFSHLIPGLPLDIAAQLLFNNFEAIHPDTELKTSNFAFNVHASKEFGLLMVYGGLQYESTNLDYNYTFEDPDVPELNERLDISVAGENNIRLTLGAALQVAVLVLNVDYNIGSQNALVAGINFAF